MANPSGIAHPNDPPRRVNLDDPEAPAVPMSLDDEPYAPQWSDEMSPGAASAIDEKTQSVVQSFGTPQQRSRDAFAGTEGFNPNIRGGAFDPREARAFTPKTFENLVALAWERWHDHAWRIEVHRDKPNDTRFRGWLGNITQADIATNEQFQERYGGGEYTCTLNVERATPAGTMMWRPDQSAKFVLPGHPVPLPVRAPPGAPVAGDTFGPPGHGGGAYGPRGESEQVAVIRAKAEAEREKMMFERAFDRSSPGANGAGDARYLTSLSEKSLALQAEQAERTVQMMQRQLDAKASELEAMRDEVRRIRKEADDRESSFRTRILEEQQAAALRVKEAREEAVRAADVQYEGKIAQAQNELRIERQEKDRILAAERELAQRRVDMAEQRATQQIDSVRAEAERNLDREKADRAREVASVTSTYEARLNSATRDNLRDKDSGNQVSNLILSAKDSQIVQLNGEVARLRLENDGLRAQVFKPFSAQVKEIQTIAPMLGFTHSSDQEAPEAPDAKPEPPKSLIEQALAMGPGLLKVAGPMMANFMGQAAVGAQPPPQQQPPVRQFAPAPVQVVQVQPPAAPPVPVRTVPTVAGGANPAAVPAVASPAKRTRIVPVPVPPANPEAPAAPVFEEIATPARFRKRQGGHQPDTPANIQVMLGLVTEQAKEAVASGGDPLVSAAMVKGLDADLSARYHGWIDSENALVLLEREDGLFWGREDAREWFDAFWNGLA